VAEHSGKILFLAGLVVALVVCWLGLPIALYERVDQPLQFSHAVHTGDLLGMSCDDCHTFDENGRFTGVPSIQNCAQCHEEPLGDSVEEKRLVEEFVAPGREIPWLIYSRQPDNVHFPHAQHVKLAAIPCERCHGPHGRTETLRPFQRNRISGYSRDIWGPSISGFTSQEWEGMKMNDCSACHQERGVVESCLDCHK
jgi:hypothetical protein